MRRTVSSWLIPVIALLALVASGTWMAVQAGGSAWAPPGSWRDAGWQRGGGMMSNGNMMGPGAMMGPGNMMGSQMMGGTGWLGEAAGPVAGMEDARERADAFARTFAGELRVGEVMRFENHYYAELTDPDGNPATEVLIDPRTGAVQLEFGPAMMWNTRYGMMAVFSGPPRVSEDEARDLAERWLGDDRTVGPAEPFPGYYTLHVLRGGDVEGMLSVNASSGTVWYHDWHGAFVELSESG